MSTATVPDVSPRPLDRRGRRMGPAAMPGFHRGRTPVTKGRTLPPDPIQVEDIVALLSRTARGEHTRIAAIRRRHDLTPATLAELEEKCGPVRPPDGEG